MDLIIREARLEGFDKPVDIGIEGQQIVAIGRKLRGRPHTEVGAEGQLVTPSFIEIHIHLDAVLTVGEPRHNKTGSLFEGIAIWGERVKSLTVDDVKRRAKQAIKWQLAHGVTHIRSHVDVCDPNLTALRAMLQVRQEVKDVVTLQLVAFPQQGIFSFEGGPELMRQAVELGVDVIGGIPHFEWTRDYGVEDVEYVVQLAAEHHLPVDVHCDETDDEHSRFLEVLAAETIKHGLEGRVTASHTTASHSYNNAYAYKLVNLCRLAGIHIVTNPLDNSVLQGRFDSYPIRRGHTRFKEFLAAGVNVCVGHDSIMDPWYPLGVGDPLQAAFVLVHYGHMSGADELNTLFQLITTNPAHTLGISHGIAIGNQADLIVWGVPTEVDAVRLLAPRRYVISRGRVVAETTLPEATVTWGRHREKVNFLKD